MYGLADEVLMVVSPVLPGTGKRFFVEGTPIAKALTHPVDLTLTSHRVFKSGVVLLCYKPR